jgi:hypothetical protein
MKKGIFAFLIGACIAVCDTVSYGNPETSIETSTISRVDAPLTQDTTISAYSLVSDSTSTEAELSNGATQAITPEVKPHEIQRSCCGQVCIVKYSNGHWQLLIDGIPFIIQGMEYSPDKVGARPENANEWMLSDENHNGKIDGPYDAFIDSNCNNVRDPWEKPVGDFELLNEMGCNTIRIYHPSNVNKKLLRALYRDYGMAIRDRLFGQEAKK